MNSEDVSHAILIELENIIGSGWSVARQGPVIVVLGPDNAEFISEVWRIARFIAYGDYVSIERQPGRKEYKVVSRSRSGLGFEVTIRASA